MRNKPIYGFFLLLFSIALIFSCKNESNLGLTKSEIIDEVHALADTVTVIALKRIDSVLSKGGTNDRLIGQLYYKKGKIFALIQNEELAIKNFEKALPYFEVTKDLEYVARAKINIGSANIYLENREESVKNLLEALEISKSLKNKEIESHCYNSLSHVYFRSDDLEKAIEYSKKAQEIQSEENFTASLSPTYNNLAILYKNAGNLKEAKKYNLLSLKINKEREDQVGISKSYNNLGQVEELLDNDELAFEYYLKAIAINNKLNAINSTPLRNIAILHQKKGTTDSAIYFFERAIEVENKTKRPKLLKLIHENLLKIAIEQNNQSVALAHQKKLDSLNSEILNQENEEKINAIESIYEAKEGEKELEQKIKDNKKNQFIFLVILFLLIATGIAFYQKNRNTKLKLEKEKLMLEQRVLRSQMNPHFIFNALSAIQNTLLDKDPMKSATYLSRFAKLIRQNFDFINQREISLIEEIDSLKNYMDTQQLRFDNKFSYEFIIDENINTNNIKIPPLLLQPFVENSIEHGFKNKSEKGLIKIIIKETEDKIYYTVEDNGSGFDVLQKGKKEHAVDVFKKRMKLLEVKNQQNFSIESGEGGTRVRFNLLK